MNFQSTNFIDRIYKRIIFSSFFLFFLVFSGIADAQHSKDKESIINDMLQYRAGEKYLNIGVKQVLSGDMIKLENDEILRLIGVDTPEVIDGSKLQFESKVCNIPEAVLKVMGNEAKLFTEGLIEKRRIRVEFGKKIKDNYENLLGYVFILAERNKDGKEVFLNAEVLKKGYSYKIDTSPNSKYIDLLEKCYDYSKTKSSQLWLQWQR